MEENIILKTYTVADLKEYFIHNRPVNLLSDEVITHTRAYATIMNPYAKDDTIVISAIFVNDKVASYTYVIPDEQDGKPIYWNTVLYVDKQYEGRGYGSIVIGQMVEIYGDAYFDLDAVPASVGNLQFAGLKVDYVEQYYLEQKHINTKTLIGKLAKCFEIIRLHLTSKKKRLKSDIKNSNYILKYSQYVNDSTYKFITQNGQGQLFQRSQKMLNWILSYPLGQESPLFNRTKESCFFSSTFQQFKRYAVDVFIKNQLVGFYMYRYSKRILYIEYVYCNSESCKDVFLSIAEHILKCNPNVFFTANEDLFVFISKYRLFAHKHIYRKSFSYPHSFFYDKTKYIQAGDGDNIT